jgi:hypothetical protein
MYYLVSTDHNGMAAYLTRSDCVGFLRDAVYHAMGGTDDDMLWNDSEDDRNGKSECEEDEGTACED